MYSLPLTYKFPFNSRTWTHCCERKRLNKFIICWFGKSLCSRTEDCTNRSRRAAFLRNGNIKIRNIRKKVLAYNMNIDYL